MISIKYKKKTLELNNKDKPPELVMPVSIYLMLLNTKNRWRRGEEGSMKTGMILLSKFESEELHAEDSIIWWLKNTNS